MLLISFVALAACATAANPPEPPPSDATRGPLSQKERCAIFMNGAADKWGTPETRMIAYHAGVKFGCW
jgi:hypothetical protein